MIGVFLAWLAAAVFLFVGVFALVRPQRILHIRARFNPIQGEDPLKERRRTGFGPREVRLCAVVLLIIGVVLVRSLSHV
jgi:hypothetical protein